MAYSSDLLWSFQLILLRIDRHRTTTNIGDQYLKSYYI
jgi:hypothetical protein